ncbi:hypothetical protein BC830DRAFT_1113354 [Chytriomyces sp. MP71]|nr:hypothetical protein BC830DRAFT_1113354 [Chytriomyces sp. MP71]
MTTLAKPTTTTSTTNLAMLQQQRSIAQTQIRSQMKKTPSTFQIVPTHIKETNFAATSKDLQNVKEICSQLQALSSNLWSEVYAKNSKDLRDLDSMKERMLAEDKLKLLEMETIVAIVNPVIRKDILRASLMSHVTDEKEISTSLQQHKDEFMQFIWKRRVQAKKQMRSLFSNGSGMICRLGDVISNSTMESIQLFEQANTIRLCRDAVRWIMCEADDIPGYLGRKVTLIHPKLATNVLLKPSRLEFNLDEKTPVGEWGCLYANTGAIPQKYTSKRFVAEMAHQTVNQLIVREESLENTSFICALAKIVDAAHPTHQLQATMLAYPLYAGTILKKKLVSLGYSIAPLSEEYGQIDANFTKGILKQLYHNLVQEQRFYFEISYPDFSLFRAGFVSAFHYDGNKHDTYPGSNECSFGFASNGDIVYNGETYQYTTFPEPNALFTTLRTVGIVIDLFFGSICMIYDHKLLPIAFGRGASAFPHSVQETQRNLILSSVLIPTFAIQAQSKATEYHGHTELTINFGKTSFLNTPDAKPFEALVQAHEFGKGAFGEVSILDSAAEGRDKGNQEDEERLQMAAEKNNFRTSLLADSLKSFSQFPPSIYRRSLACTKIQRAWRMFRGKRERKRLRERQYEAATIIQRVARRKLRHLRAKKHEAAAKIQKNWRKLSFIWIALMRCRYQTPIPELHRAAGVIQRKWRHWFMFRNSPIAARYNARIEDIEAAVNKIIAWWRPLCIKISERKKQREKHDAATAIQRVWRGYILRHILRDDVRKKLTAIGQKIAQHRGELIRIRAAYILQKAWRNYIQRRVRSDKIKTRHTAAARLQSFWKGYWVRSHVHLRFSYGEAVFLIAVCKALRNCHFLLKVYR